MKTVMLYGFLGRQFGRVHRYDVRTPAEAVRALSVTLQGFRQALIDGGAYQVLIGGKSNIGREQLCDPVSGRETIRIIPVVAGAGRGIGQTILGAVLVVAGYWTGNAYLANTGIAMMIGGVSQMLFAPKPTSGPADRPENRPSFSFDGAVNTAAQGNPVPVLYGGPLIVGSQVISAGLSVEQI